MSVDDFLLGVAVGSLGNLAISVLFPGPLPRARRVNPDNHLYLHDTTNVTILRGADQDKLRAVASRALCGRPLTYKALTGKGRMYTRDEWDKLREQLERRGLITFGRGNVVKVTEYGMRAFSQLAKGR